MLNRVVLAVVVGIVVTLVCVLVGALLITLNIDLAVTVGTFLKQWSGVIGVLAALWYFFSGTTWPNRGV